MAKITYKKIKTWSDQELMSELDLLCDDVDETIRTKLIFNQFFQGDNPTTIITNTTKKNIERMFGELEKRSLLNGRKTFPSICMKCENKMFNERWYVWFYWYQNRLICSENDMTIFDETLEYSGFNKDIPKNCPYKLEHIMMHEGENQ